MAKFISRRNPISSSSLKRRPLGTIVVHHNGNWETIRFTRTNGGWVRERIDFFGLSSMIISSADVARECNMALGCQESWARIY